VIVNAEGITDRCSLIGGGMGVIRWQEVSGIFPLTYSWNPNYAYLVIVPWHKGTALGRRGPLVRIFLRTISLILPGSLGLPDWLLSVPAGELWNRIHERFRECLVANDIVFPHRAMAAEKGLRAMDWKIELLIVPVSDVDRAKAFYADQVGFHADHDQRVSETLRFVQLTPPGSTCSIAIGEGITDTAPGSASGIQMVVPDINAAHAHLAEHGVAVSDIEHLAWGSFVYFADPDGNRWSVQQHPPRG
jgi:catechol 2,3-dioxygenase-like lactoylglutathione lyase family enzyme